ncbi:MAG: DUF2953 domain-containing protein [Candidatus Omnitrophica bacterium]|nr:DUF2953 domain-containing protein [Candidatus Omnitrophota bacterium]
MESGDALTGFVIIGIILSILIALCFVRISITARYSEIGLEAWAKIAFVRIPLYPPNKKVRTQAKKTVKEVKKKIKEETEEKGGPFEQFKRYYDLAIDLLKTLRKIIRIDRLKVRFTAAAKDEPAKAAVLYGKAWAAEGIILAVLENNIQVRKKEIAIEVDYLADRPTIYCFTKASVSVGGLFLGAFRFAKKFISHKVKEKGGTKNGKTNR